MSPDLDGVLEVVRLTFVVSGIALFFSAVLGIPVGAWLGLRRFAGLTDTLKYVSEPAASDAGKHPRDAAAAGWQAS